MTTYHWADTYDDACRRFHQAPRTADEQIVREHFQQRPAHVITEITQVAEAIDRAEITWGWSALAARLDRGKNRDVIVTDKPERDKETRRAEQWIRHAGHHIPTEEGLIAALFGETDLSASTEVLEALELETRNNPGRELYGPLLEAAIKRTRNQGRQPVVVSAGPLNPFDTTELRNRMVTLWRNERPRAETTEAAYHERARRYRASHSEPDNLIPLAALLELEPTQDDDP